MTETRHLHGFSLEAWGEFVDTGTFEQDGDWVDITYDWRIRADKSLLRYLSFLMKPAFGANYHWAMARGEESLKLELQRRHASTPEARAQIPLPPGASFTHPVPTLATTVLVAGAAGLAYRAFRRRSSQSRPS